MPWRGERITATMVQGHPANMAAMPSLPMMPPAPAGQAMGAQERMQPSRLGAKPIRFKRWA